MVIAKVLFLTTMKQNTDFPYELFYMFLCPFHNPIGHEQESHNFGLHWEKNAKWKSGLHIVWGMIIPKI